MVYGESWSTMDHVQVRVSTLSSGSNHKTAEIKTFTFKQLEKSHVL